MLNLSQFTNFMRAVFLLSRLYGRWLGDGAERGKGRPREQANVVREIKND